LINDDYIIEVRGDVLYSKLIGKWDLSKDIRYSMEYSTIAQRLRNRPWAILCDMSQWSLSIKKPEKRSLVNTFDRRNQIAECWVIKDEKQVVALKPYLASYPHIRLNWFTDAREAGNWIAKQPLSYIQH
jgi:hypothetical protein